MRTVHLYSSNASLVKEVKTICGNHTTVVECVRPLPREVDYVVTKSVLNSTIERFAGALGVWPLVLPEAADFLVSKLESKGQLVLVGADEAK